MLYKIKFLVKLVGIFIVVVNSFTPTLVSAFANAEEMRLFRLVNEYRVRNGLPEIPFSRSLTFVAQMHVRDLNSHPPDGDCNMHSWSSNGSWSSCCYTLDHARAQCMWNKPRELTSYPGNGYECVLGGLGQYQANATSAFEGWKRSHPHNAVLLNKGIWSKIHWRALGVGVYKNYASLWFGEEADPVP